MRWGIFSLGVAASLCVSSSLTADASPKSVQGYIKGLSSPDITARSNACLRLGRVGKDDQDAAVDALLGAFNDLSESVHHSAVVALGNIGPGAKKAVPSLIKFYSRGSCPKSEVIKTIGRIGAESPEGLDFLIDLVRGGKSGDPRQMQQFKPEGVHRCEAIHSLTRIGPKAAKAMPVLMKVLTMSATDLPSQESTFRAAAEAVSIIGVGDKSVPPVLEELRAGKGFSSKSSKSAVKHAILVADSAIKRLQQAEEAAAQKEKDAHNE